MEKPKPPEAVSPHPGGSAGRKAGEHGGQEGKSALSVPAFAMPALSQCRDTKILWGGEQLKYKQAVKKNTHLEQSHPERQMGRWRQNHAVAQGINRRDPIPEVGY